MKLLVTCKCPECGTAVTITKAEAARILGANRKKQSKKQLSENGKKGAATRWHKNKQNDKIKN
jgi:ribosomal protein L13